MVNCPSILNYHIWHPNEKHPPPFSTNTNTIRCNILIPSVYSSHSPMVLLFRGVIPNQFATRTAQLLSQPTSVSKLFLEVVVSLYPVYFQDLRTNNGHFQQFNSVQCACKVNHEDMKTDKQLHTNMPIETTAYINTHMYA